MERLARRSRADRNNRETGVVEQSRINQPVNYSTPRIHIAGNRSSTHPEIDEVKIQTSASSVENSSRFEAKC